MPTEQWKPDSSQLYQEMDGFWIARTITALSYPESGNDHCLQVEDTSYWFAHRNRCITNVIRNYPPAGIIVDVGGGNGFVSLALQQEGLNVVLVEPGMSGARNSWQRGVRPVVCADLQDAGFAASSVEGVGIFDVLEHIEDDVKFLEIIGSILRLDVSVPAYGALWSTVDAETRRFRRYCAAGLYNTLHKAGSDMEYFSGMFAWFPVPTLLLLFGMHGESKEHIGRGHQIPNRAIGCVDSCLSDDEFVRVEQGASTLFDSGLVVPVDLRSKRSARCDVIALDSR